MRITDPDLLQKVSQAMGDVDTPRILHSIRTSAKNAQTISNETGVPLSSIYRKLAALKNAGLAYVKSFEITPEGKRQDLFISAVTEVRVGMSGDEVQIDLIPTEESANRIWLKLFSS